jgi:hypothetical protein
MKHLSVIGLAALGFLMLPTPASAKCTGNSNPVLVQNDGFESGTGTNIPDWTVFNTADNEFGAFSDIPKSGMQSLRMATVGGENRIAQTITTTAGSVYTVCFWLTPGAAVGPDSFRAQWNNQDMIVLKNIGSPTGVGQFTFAYYQFSVVATGNDVLSFEGRNDPGVFYLDNVDVELCTACSISNGAMQAKKKVTFSAFKP